MKRFALFCLFVFICYSNLKAQTWQRSFKGRVVDSSSLKPIPDATISIFSAKDTMLLNFGFTTPNGNFTLSTKSNDSVLIVISITGYNEHTIKDPMQVGGWMFEDYGDIKLSPLAFSLKGFTEPIPLEEMPTVMLFKNKFFNMLPDGVSSTSILPNKSSPSHHNFCML